MPRFSAIFSNSNPETLIRFASEIDGEKIFSLSEKVVLSLTAHRTGNAGFYQFEEFSAVGEIQIDNRDEIRKQIGSIAASDGELLLELYAKEGVKALDRIDGMFGAAVYDGESLILIRDAVGRKTLFYTRTGDSFAASSSLGSLRKFSELETGLNLHAVASFLTFAYLPGAETLLENVFELLPGHALKISSGGQSELINYYEPAEQIDESLSTPEHVRILREKLEKSILDKLPDTDEEIGVFLSGGIDSSLVAALAAKFRPGRVRTYSISFGNDNPNETAYSGLVAAHCGTNHRVLSFSGRQIAEYLAETVALLDCPVGDPLTVPNFLLARAAAQDGLRHVFNGEGGDPCFGGPKNLPLLVFALQREQHQSLATIYLHSYRKCYDDLPFLLSPEARSELNGRLNLEKFVEPFLETPAMNSYLNRLLYVNIRTKLAHHILPKVERMTSFWHLTGHSPLADKRIVDASFAIPPELKLHGTIEKWILKEAVRDLLPATIIDRPKSGMRVPVQNWLHGALRELSNDLLFGRRARQRGLFQEKTIRTWLRGEGLTYARHGGKLWLLLTLELWLQSFLDSEQ